MYPVLKAIMLTGGFLAGGLFVGEVVLAETIELTDGTRLLGDVKSLKNGVYVIDTPSMGKVRIEQAKVRSIGNSSTNTNQANTNVDNGLSIDAIRKSIISDPAAMKSIQALQNDPQIKAILADPEIMQLINNGNLNALKNNPKIQQLMNTPTIRSVTKQIIGQ